MSSNQYRLYRVNRLLRRYRKGNCSESERQTVDLWFEKIGEGDGDLNEFERESVRIEILKGLQQKAFHGNAKKDRDKQHFLKTFLRVAAVVTMFLATGYFVFFEMKSLSGGTLTKAVVKNDFINIESISGQVIEIQLPDSSSVLLQANSKLRYPKTWDAQKREVYLTGEAFFDIEKDHKRPFFVYSGNIVTKVLGTSFFVRALPEAQSVDVEVQTGKVSVYEESTLAQSGTRTASNGVILSPNHQVKYFKENKQFVTGLIKDPRPMRVIEKSEDYVFDDANLKSIIDQIEKDFFIQVVVEREAIYACTFTGDVSKLKLFDMLEIICKSTGATFEIKGTMILLNGKGCEQNSIY